MGTNVRKHYTSGKMLHRLCRARLDSDYYNGYVLEEIWLEILLRLPIKSLLVCRSVCKLWRSICASVRKMIGQILRLPFKSLPLCGLLIRSRVDNVTNTNIHAKYICLTTSFDKRLLGDLRFDIGALDVLKTSSFDKKPVSLLSHKGLVLLEYNDGNYEVHNPVTKEVFEVPMSPHVEVYGTAYVRQRSSLLFINFSLSGTKSQCIFFIIRYYPKRNYLEIYDSMIQEEHKWIHKKLENVVGFASTAMVGTENYVAFRKNMSLSIYFIRREDHGVALKLDDVRSPLQNTHYQFPLPTLVNRDGRKARLWDCETSLLLSYYNPADLCVWKAGSTQADTWAWVSLLKIRSLEPLKKGVELVKFLKAGDQVIPVACHPYARILYLVIKPNIFGYDIVNDKLDKIGEMNDFVDEFMAGEFLAYPFTPCIASYRPYLADHLKKP